MLAEEEPSDISLDEVVLAGLLSLAHPLGKLALTDVETDGAVCGITGAGESGVISVTHNVEMNKVTKLKMNNVYEKGDKCVALMGET